MSEILGAIEANADQASARRQEEEAARDKALAEWQAQEERRRIRRRKRETLRLAVRALAVLVLVLLLCAAQDAGLIDARLAGMVSTVLSCWLCIWVGAWLQFMWCKGGLLR